MQNCVAQRRQLLIDVGFDGRVDRRHLLGRFRLRNFLVSTSRKVQLRLRGIVCESVKLCTQSLDF